MVKRSTLPSSCYMAAVAFNSGRYMCGRLADSCYIIVAAAAWAGYVDVVKSGASPGIGIMADVALGKCRNVLWMLAGSLGSVVARVARAKNSCVVDPAYAVECKRVMAILTLRGRGNM